MKKVMFRNKPNNDSYGQYNFSDDESTFEFLNSSSVPRRYDKFSDKDLYTTVVDNSLNQAIIDGQLQYNKNSYINIDKIKIENAGVAHDVTRIKTDVFLCDDLSFTDPNFNLADYNSVTDALTDIEGTQKIYSHNRGENEIAEGKDLGVIMQDAMILTNLYSDPTYLANWTHAVDTWNWESSFSGEDEATSPILDFSGQKIYIIVNTSGDQEIPWWPDNDRRKRLHVFEIDTENDLISPENGGGITQLQFEYGDAVVSEGGDGLTPAWKVTELRVTINTTPDTQDADYNPSEIYHPITGSVTPPVKVELGKNFNSNILRINPSAQLPIEEDFSNLKYNYIPVSETNIKSTNYNLQSYYMSDEERQRVSAPTKVDLDFSIRNMSLADGVELTLMSNPSLQHMFYVLSWNDIDNKFKTWEDITSDLPTDEVELIEKQQENLYIFNNTGLPLSNDYTTPGIKTIKSVMFSYNQDGNIIEPVRWKFITTRIFLDIPVNQYPDFSEVGGADYTTIPWPHTTAIIGGIDENSKYKKSIRDTLGGGKLGNQDIIDQTFLISDDENDELGQSIRKFDLEQVRYFNSSYDMTSLLGINVTTDGTDFTPYNSINANGTSYWDGETNSFSEESSVGQIFISDNSDSILKKDCKLELNCGDLTGKSIVDSSGNSNKGLLIGDYKIKKTRKNRPMRRDSFIKIPKKNDNSNGAL